MTNEQKIENLAKNGTITVARGYIYKINGINAAGIIRALDAIAQKYGCHVIDMTRRFVVCSNERDYESPRLGYAYAEIPDPLASMIDGKFSTPRNIWA